MNIRPSRRTKVFSRVTNSLRKEECKITFSLIILIDTWGKCASGHKCLCPHAEHEYKWRLTRGRGMTEHQRLVWLMSHPVCAEVNDAMHQLCWCTVQHKCATQRLDHGKAGEIYERVMWTIRVSWISKPIQWQLQFAKHCDRNQCWQQCKRGHRNISRRDDLGVNCAAKSVAIHLQEKYQAVTLSTSAVRVNNETIQIDPQLFFKGSSQQELGVISWKTSSNSKFAAIPQQSATPDLCYEAC